MRSKFKFDVGAWVCAGFMSQCSFRHSSRRRPSSMLFRLLIARPSVLRSNTKSVDHVQEALAKWSWRYDNKARPLSLLGGILLTQILIEAVLPVLLRTTLIGDTHSMKLISQLVRGGWVWWCSKCVVADTYERISI